MSSDATSEGEDMLLPKIETRVANRVAKHEIAAPLLRHAEKRQLDSLDFDQQQMDQFERVRSLMKEDSSAREHRGDWYCNTVLQTAKGTPERKLRLKELEKKRARDGRLRMIRRSIFEGKDPKDKDAKKVLQQVLAKLHWLCPIPAADYEPVPIKESNADVLPRLRALNRKPPQYMYRASSWQGGEHTKRTNGHDEIHFHLPAAFKNQDGMLAPTIDDEYNGLSELVEKIGRRLIWCERRNDPNLSWTSSLLFALVHATGRLAKGQKYVTIHTINTSKVTTINPRGARAVEFFMAQDLLRELNIADWRGWEDDHERTSLQRPWYTHEWITHHGVLVPPGEERSAYEADIEELIEAGLWDLVPHLKTPDEDDMKGLYDRCVYTRSIGHMEDFDGVGPKPFTQEELELADKLAACFRWRHRESWNTITGRMEPNRGSGNVQQSSTPAMNIFFDLLSMSARPSQDPKFMSWITEHYIAADMVNLDFAGLSRVANNLPEQAQSLRLARDAVVALGLPVSVPPTRVWCADPEFDWHCTWGHRHARPLHIKAAGPKSVPAKEIMGHLCGQDAQQQVQPPEDQNADASSASETMEGAETTNDSTPNGEPYRDINTSRTSLTAESELAQATAENVAKRSDDLGLQPMQPSSLPENDEEPAPKRQKLMNGDSSGVAGASLRLA